VNRAKRRTPSKEPEPDALYRVYRATDDQLAYLPGTTTPNGVPREEAERLSNQLGVATYIKKVWERPEE